MTIRRAKIWAAAALTSLGLATALAHAEGILPEGWVRQDSAPEKTLKSPACCGFDSACCDRQSSVDAARPILWKEEPVTVDLDRLAVALVEKAPSAEIDEGFGELGVYDGLWRPHPDLPRSPALGIVGLVAPGRAGSIHLGSGAEFFSSSEAPFYRDRALFERGRGLEYTFHASVPADQPISWESIDVHPDGGLDYRSYSGRYNRHTGRSTLGERVRARAVDVAGGLVYAFRVRRGADEEIRLLVPGGGFLGRAPFNTVTLPLGPGAGAMTHRSASIFEVRVWKSLGAAPSRDAGVRVLLGASRARSESQATVVVAIEPES